MSDGLYTFVVRIANVVAAAVLGILTARLLGPEGKGTYALPMIQATLVATTFSGLTSATTYFLLNSDAGNRRTLAVALRASVPFLLGGARACLPWELSGRRDGRFRPPSLSAGERRDSRRHGLRHRHQARTLCDGHHDCHVQSRIWRWRRSGYFWSRGRLTVAIAAWLVSINIIAAIALAATIVHAHRSPAAGAAISTGSFLRLAAKVGSTGVVTLLNYRADLYVVAIFLPTAALGLYTVAISAAEACFYPRRSPLW